MLGTSNFAILVFRYALSISGILKVAAHNFMKSRSRDGLAAKSLLDTRSVLLKNMTYWHKCSAESRLLYCDRFLPCDPQHVSCRTHPWTSLRFIRRVFSLLSLLLQAHVKIQIHDHGCFFRDISNLQRTRYLCLVMEDSYTLKN